MTHNAMVSGFVDSLQDPRTPYISPKRLSKSLGDRRSPQHSPQSFVGAPAGQNAGDGEGDFGCNGTHRRQRRAIYWYRNEPIVDYGHRTAAELVAEGHTEAVLAFIRDLENGASG
jgi:hypothetical protein